MTKNTKKTGKTKSNPLKTEIYKVRGKPKQVVNEFTKYIDSLGFTDKYLAEEIGMVRITFAKKRNNPKEFTIKQIEKLADILGADTQYIIDIIRGNEKV